MKREESCSYLCDGVEVKQLVSEFRCFSYLCIGPSHGTFLVVIQVVYKFRIFEFYLNFVSSCNLNFLSELCNVLCCICSCIYA